MSEENSGAGIELQLAELEGLRVQAEQEDKPEEAQSQSGEGGEVEQEEMSTGQLMSGVLALGFGLVASRRGAHWALSGAEAEQTGEALGALMDKYFPDMSSHGPELVAVLAVGSIVAPRLAADSQIEAAKQKQKAVQAAKASKVDEKEDAPVLDMEGE